MLKGTDLNAPIKSYMQADCTRFVVGQTVGETLESLRREPPGERIIYFYVVDLAGQLRGVVPTRRLLLSKPHIGIEEIMIENVVTLREASTVQEACELFALHRFLALPVVDKERLLLGAVDIQLYTDELDQLNDVETRSTLFQALGVYSEGRDSLRSPIDAFRSRFPWLGSNLVGGLVCAVLASSFQDELSRVVVLSLFIPVVLNLAESVSNQSVSLTLHVLQAQRPSWRFIVAGMRQELATGLLLGGACGAVVGTVALVWLGQARVAMTLFGGILCGVAMSALLGLTLPVALRVLRLDPKVAAGPIALAGADVATLLVYLLVARRLLA